jgi:hypothetical protein
MAAAFLFRSADRVGSLQNANRPPCPLSSGLGSRKAYAFENLFTRRLRKATNDLGVTKHPAVSGRASARKP